MTRKIKLHDGIVGALITASVALALTVNVNFLYLAGLTGLIMVSSAFTGFCPVHFTLAKLLGPDAP
jgi:hypothetical protein